MVQIQPGPPKNLLNQTSFSFSDVEYVFTEGNQMWTIFELIYDFDDCFHVPVQEFATEAEANSRLDELENMYKYSNTPPVFSVEYVDWLDF